MYVVVVAVRTWVTLIIREVELAHEYVLSFTWESYAFIVCSEGLQYGLVLYGFVCMIESLLKEGIDDL